MMWADGNENCERQLVRRPCQAVQRPCQAVRRPGPSEVRVDKARRQAAAAKR